VQAGELVHRPPTCAPPSQGEPRDLPRQRRRSRIVHCLAEEGVTDARRSQNDTQKDQAKSGKSFHPITHKSIIAPKATIARPYQRRIFNACERSQLTQALAVARLPATTRMTTNGSKNSTLYNPR